MGYYDDFNKEQEEGSNSQFNAGLLQMKRIHEIQDLLNRASLNPLAFNEELGVYNYQIIFSSTCSLLNEASPKLGKDERKDAEKLRNGIREFIVKFPIYELKKDIKAGSNYSTNSLNKKHWQILLDWLQTYETLIRNLLDKHQLNSPNKEDDDGL